jgi:ribosomal-protein-alanine N-acetyltransferase
MSARSVRALLKSPSALVLVAAPSPESRVRSPGLFGALIVLTRRNSRIARIYSVVVSADARGQGLGRRLVEHSERAMAKRGCEALSLEVREDNAAARALYARMGYCLAERLTGYYEDGGHGLRLRRPLKPASR